MSKTAILAIRIIADAAGAQKGIAATTSSLDKFEASVQRASKYAAVGLAAMAAGAWKASGAASDLAESTNAVEKTFGTAAGTITSFGEQAAKAAGLSQREFQGLATSTGSLLTNFGYSAQQAADQTVELAVRAADMASVFNTDVDQALNAINAGLRGESEPLRAFGVNLGDAALKAEAMALGLYEGTGALDQNAKAQAAVSLVMQQTTKTAGDFSDTADSLANRERILNATLEDTSAQLGEALLPYFEDGVGLLQDVADWTSENTGTVTKLAAALTVTAAAVLAVNVALKAYRATQAAVNAVLAIARSRVIANTAATVAYHVITKTIRVALLAWTAAQWLLNAALTANPVGLVVAAIAALVAGVVLAYKRSETFRRIVDGLGRTLSRVVSAGIRAVSSALSTLVGWFRSAWDWANRLAGRLGSLLDKLNPLKGLGGILGGIGFSAGAPAAGSYAAAVPTLRAGEPITPTSSAGTLAPVTIYVQAADPWSTARYLKRSLANLDESFGRAAGTAQAPAW